ncbi:unnamed protein product, partial [Coregonus sp. 'balchen']
MLRLLIQPTNRQSIAGHVLQLLSMTCYCTKGTQHFSTLVWLKTIRILCLVPRLSPPSIVFCGNYLTSFDLVKFLQTRLGVRCIGA